MPPAPERCIPLVHCSAIRPRGWEKTRTRRLPRTHRQGFAVKRVDSQRRASGPPRLYVNPGGQQDGQGVQQVCQPLFF
ncbi:unnamed protein product [Boreogadus saida]